MSLVIRSAPFEPFTEAAIGRDGVSPSVPWAAGRWGWPEGLGPYRGGGSGPDGPLVEIRASRPAGLVGTVSHRPFPGLPGEVGMARGTRALSGGALVKGLAFWRPRWKIPTA